MKHIDDKLTWGSHQEVLLNIIKRTEKPILELGAGNFSTYQIHENCKNEITTIDSSKIWLSKFCSLENKRHALLFMSEKEMIEWFFLKDTCQWGLVFVDSGTWIGRSAAIRKYKDIADYIIVHDTEYSAQVGIFGKLLPEGKRDFSNYFNQWIEFMPRHVLQLPATLLGSNKMSLKDIEIQNMIVMNSLL